jgi:hypothetical protein
MKILISSIFTILLLTAAIAFFPQSSQSQQPSTQIQLEPLTLDKLAEKFVSEHSTEMAHCLVLKVTNDQLIEMNSKLLTQINDLQKQLDASKKEDKVEHLPVTKEVKP